MRARQRSSVASWIVAVAVSTSCASRVTTTSAPASTSQGVRGTPSDMKTRAGSYDGYDVFRSCTNGSGSSSLVVVMGTGSVEFPWLAKGFDDHGNLDPALMEQFRTSAQATAGPRIHATGFGVACRGTRLAFHMELADWRTVDGVIERLGAWLRQKDYRGEIVVDILPMPSLL